MKYLFILFLSLSALAQDTIQADVELLKVNTGNARVVVKTETPNVVYRGITNKIIVAVAGVPDWDVTTSAPGTLKHSGTSGEFEWNVTEVTGKTAKLTVAARMPNGERKVEQIEFEVKSIENLVVQINSQGCERCIVQQTLAELKDGVISIVPDITPDPYKDLRILIRSFTLTFPDGKKIVVNGNKINMAAYNIIKELRPGAIIIIDHLDHYISGASYYPVENYTAKIQLAE